jgi:hypothetical protein
VCFLPEFLFTDAHPLAHFHSNFHTLPIFNSTPAITIFELLPHKSFQIKHRHNVHRRESLHVLEKKVSRPISNRIQSPNNLLNNNIKHVYFPRRNLHSKLLFYVCANCRNISDRLDCTIIDQLFQPIQGNIAINEPHSRLEFLIIQLNLNVADEEVGNWK